MAGGPHPRGGGGGGPARRHSWLAASLPQGEHWGEPLFPILWQDFPECSGVCNRVSTSETDNNDTKHQPPFRGRANPASEMGWMKLTPAFLGKQLRGTWRRRQAEASAQEYQEGCLAAPLPALGLSPSACGFLSQHKALVTGCALTLPP